MHIAHLSTAVTLNQTVLNRMIYQKNCGHRVVALCPDDEWAEGVRAHGIEVIEVPFIRHNLIQSFTRAALRTYQICRRERFDVVHTHTLLPGIAGRIAARLAGIPLVVHTFHSWVLHKPRSLLFRLVYQALELLAAYFGHVMLFQNSDDLQAWSRISAIPKQRAVLIGNGIDINKIISQVKPNARERIRQEFNIDKNVFLTVVIARLELYKGHSTLLRAFKQIVSSTSHQIAALFIGIGEDRHLIESEIGQLGLKDIVKFTGYRQDVPDIITASDLSVLTSQYEGIPRALMESMILGKPVIGTDVPGNSSLIQSRENGILVEHDNASGLASAIIELMENPALASLLAENGRQTILSNYDENKVAAYEIELYQQFLKSGVSQPSEWSPDTDAYS